MLLVRNNIGGRTNTLEVQPFVFLLVNTENGSYYL